MSKPIIEVKDLSKRYRLGEFSAGSLREEVEIFFNRLRGNGKAPPRRAGAQEEFWALRDVSFDIEAGAVIGIVGRNGAGKSTLLKILSRITEPTSGDVLLRGRVASLLEVGTGFHPELTGRENIFLNGAILGLKRSEITQRLDEIIAFSEVEEFIDTPIKRYSSGMYVRLAFAVAAHLNPEILIVDEVLAVGDAAFQRKCLGKMREASAQEGNTVLFVSHNTEAVCALCTSCLLLQNGRLVDFGPTAEIVGRYLGAEDPARASIVFPESHRPAHFLEAGFYNAAGIVTREFISPEEIQLRCSFEVVGALSGLELAFAVSNYRGERLFYSTNVVEGSEPIATAPGVYRWSAVIPGGLLLPGRYFVNLALHRPHVELYEFHEQILAFEMLQSRGSFHGFSSNSLGYFHADVRWRLEKSP